MLHARRQNRFLTRSRDEPSIRFQRGTGRKPSVYIGPLPTNQVFKENGVMAMLLPAHRIPFLAIHSTLPVSFQTSRAIIPLQVTPISNSVPTGPSMAENGLRLFMRNTWRKGDPMANGTKMYRRLDESRSCRQFCKVDLKSTKQFGEIVKRRPCSKSCLFRH